MDSIFLEGLTVALQLIEEEGIGSLKRLIEEHKNGTIETAAVRPAAETR